MVLVTHEGTPVGKEFHAHGPATQKALSLRHRSARGTLKSPRKLECKRVSEQHLQSSVR